MVRVKRTPIRNYKRPIRAPMKRFNASKSRIFLDRNKFQTHRAMVNKYTVAQFRAKTRARNMRQALSSFPSASIYAKRIKGPVTTRALAYARKQGKIFIRRPQKPSIKSMGRNFRLR